MIADSRPYKFTVAMVSLRSEFSVRKRIEWAGFTSTLVKFASFNDAKISKQVKNYSRKSAWFTIHAKVNAYFTDHENIGNQFPEDGK